MLDELDSSGRPGGRDVEAAPVVAQRGVDHVGITVPDLEEATAFFVEVLGCVVLYEHPGSDPARAYARLGAEPGAHPRRVRMLRCANSANIELFEWEAPRQRTDFPRPSDQAIQHVAIYVEDVDAAARALREHGIEVLAGPNPLPGPEAGAGNRFVYTRTPWGMTLELISYPSPLTYPAEVSATRWVPAPRGF